MTLQEFKAWFDGFSTNISGPPNKTQWKKICDKVADIDDMPTPVTPFKSVYIPPVVTYIPSVPYRPRRHWYWEHQATIGSMEYRALGSIEYTAPTQT